MNQKIFISTILIFVFIALVAVIGYFVLGREQGAQFPREQKAVSSTSETSGWLVYQDSMHGFEVKYPAGYQLTKSSSCKTDSRDANKPQNTIIFFNENYIRNFGQDDDIAKYGIIDFDININDPNDECVSGRYPQLIPPGVDPSEVKGYTQTGSENIELNGYKILRRDYIDVTHPSEIAYKFSTWRFERDGSYYTLLYNNGQPIDPERHKDLFLTFLSTFRFTR